MSAADQVVGLPVTYRRKPDRVRARTHTHSIISCEVQTATHLIKSGEAWLTLLRAFHRLGGSSHTHFP